MLLSSLLLRLQAARFRLLGLATAHPISTEHFNEIVAQLLKEGWIKSYEYQGWDAWIDYGKLVLTHPTGRLKFEWDNWTEGSIEGRAALVAMLAQRFGLASRPEWRWADHHKPATTS